MKKKKRLILIGIAVVLSGVLCGNLTIVDTSKEKCLVFSNIDALAQTESSNPKDECIRTGFICVGLKDGHLGSYSGLALGK